MSGALRTVAKVAGVVATIAVLTGHPEIAAIANVVATAASPASHVTTKKERQPMTAIGMFHDRRSAYMVTDGAAFDVIAGKITTLGPKVLMLPDLSLAIGIQGHGCLEGLRDVMTGVPSGSTQAEVLNALPTALATYRLSMSVYYQPISETRLAVAIYDRVACEPRLFTVSSGHFEGGPPSDDIYSLEEHGEFITGLSAEQVADLAPAGLGHNPIRDGLNLLEAQRGAPFQMYGGMCGVAGECGVYTIDRRGVSYKPLIRYPEGVGEIADPARPGMLVA